MIKLRFYWKPYINRFGKQDFHGCEEIFGQEEEHENPYVKYLASAFHFDINSAINCEEIFTEIDKVQRGEKDKTGWSGNAFDTIIYRDRVEIDHQQFADHPDWPTWTFSLPLYMKALDGWMQFLKLPISAESSVVVELDI